MENSVLSWIADETLLQAVVAGQSTAVLLIIIVICIAMLSLGADWMIDGVVDLAERTGLPKIVIGATIISLGTTLPVPFEISSMMSIICFCSVKANPISYANSVSAAYSVVLKEVLVYEILR